jgi:hypothetical protein
MKTVDTTFKIKLFIYQLMHKSFVPKEILKFALKNVPTCFGLITIIRERAI